MLIYTDECCAELKKQLSDNDINIILRDKNLWDIPSIMSHVCNPQIDLILINNIDELSISEITLATLFSKKVMVTDNTVNTYDYAVTNFIDYIEIDCNLNYLNNFNHILQWTKKWKTTKV